MIEKKILKCFYCGEICDFEGSTNEDWLIFTEEIGWKSFIDEKDKNRIKVSCPNCLKHLTCQVIETNPKPLLKHGEKFQHLQEKINCARSSHK